jgi:hypothetical protein
VTAYPHTLVREEVTGWKFRCTACGRRSRTATSRQTCVPRMQAAIEWLTEEVIGHTGGTREEIAECMQAPAHKPVPGHRAGAAFRARCASEREHYRAGLQRAADICDVWGVKSCAREIRVELAKVPA